MRLPHIALAAVMAAGAMFAAAPHANAGALSLDLPDAAKHAGRLDVTPVDVKFSFRFDGGRVYFNGHRGFKHYRKGYRKHRGYYFPHHAFRVVIHPRHGYHYRKRYKKRYRVVDLPRAHYRWCDNRYISYRYWDNSFQPYHGPRKPCRSPYYH